MDNIDREIRDARLLALKQARINEITFQACLALIPPTYCKYRTNTRMIHTIHGVVRIEEQSLVQ